MFIIFLYLLIKRGHKYDYKNEDISNDIVSQSHTHTHALCFSKLFKNMKNYKPKFYETGSNLF